MKTGKLILASRSERRRQLLAQIGVECECRPADIDESVLTGETPADYVGRLAREKAMAVGAAKAERVVLGADTTVVARDQILGKPTDEKDAITMLSLLADGWHEVLTGVAIMHNDKTWQTVTCTRVRFGAITDDQSRAYWATGEPADKAGGYAIQGIGAQFVDRIDGSYSGVVGLPLAETARALNKFGIHTALGHARA